MFKNDPNRSETVQISLKLDSKYARRHHEAIQTVFDGRPPFVLASRDSLYVDYTFNVTYFDDVASKLDAISQILADPNVAVSASLEELRHGRSVIFEVGTAIDRVIQVQKARMENRDPHA